MKTFSKFISIILCFALVLSYAAVGFAAETTETQITSMEELVSGTYKIVCGEVNLGVLDGTWVRTTESTWTVTVDGTNATLTDANGVTIAPKGGNNNGITSGDYSWAVTCEDGLFYFWGQGDDTVVLAYNAANEGYRAYKTSTVSGNPSGYPSAFTLYLVEEVDAGTTEPETSEPETSEPETSEPETTEPAVVTLAEAAAIGAAMEHNTYTEEKYIVTGTIINVASAQYGNTTIEDAEGNTLLIYGVYDVDGTNRYDAMDPKPELGDTITVLGVLGQYNGTAQMKNGWVQELVDGAPVEEPDPTEVTIPEANEIGLAMGHNTYTTEKYLVTGTITEIKNTTYGNMYIEDAEGNTLYLYGVYSADGTVRFDAMDPQPAVGDTITIVGVLGQYSGTAQMKNGYVQEIVPGEVEPEPEPEPVVVTIPEANAIGEAMEHNTYTTGKYIVTGVITEIANTTYGNMYIEDAEGNIMYIYGTWNADGSARFDAMDPQPAVGDTITVVGVLGQYNGTAQMKNGWITEIVVKEEPTVESTLFVGNNEFAVSSEVLEDTRVHVAEQTGTLHITFRSIGYGSDNFNGGEGVLDYNDNWFRLTINGELVDSMKKTVEVTAGELVTISLVSLDNDFYFSSIYLSYEDFYEEPLGTELNPIPLTPEECPVSTPELGANEEVWYQLDDAFYDYILYVYGENAYVIHEGWNENDGWAEMRTEAVDGVICMAVWDYNITIGNAGETPATFTIDAVLPLGSESNPDQLVIGENETQMSADMFAYYYTWTAEADGTLTVTLSGDEYWAFRLQNPNTTEEYYYFQLSEEPNTASVTVSEGDQIWVMVRLMDEDWMEADGTVMVLAEFTPAGEEGGETVESDVYVLDATDDLTAMAAGEKANGDTEQVGTDGFFTIIYGEKTKIDASDKTFEDGYSGSQRLNFQGKTTSDMVYSVKFTTDGASTVKLWWVAGGDGRYFAIYDENGEILCNTSADTTKNSLYISELTLDAAGTYYLGLPEGSNYLFKMEVAVENTTGEEGGEEPETPEAEQVIFDMNEETATGTATVTVENGETGYYYAYGIGGMVLTVTDSEGNVVYTETLPAGMPMVPVYFNVTNENADLPYGDVNGDDKINTTDAKLIMQYELKLIGEDALDVSLADVNGDGKINTTDAKLVMQLELGLVDGFAASSEEYTLTVTYPEGSMMNPAELTMGYNGVELGEGEIYYYSYTAEADGLLTVTMLSDNWFYVVNNMTTYSYGYMRYSDDETPVNVTVVKVSAGDVIEVQVGTADYLGGYVGFNARFNAGTTEDPAYLEMYEKGYGFELNAELPAGEYVYSLPLYGTSVMELFVNGEKTEYTVVDPFGYYDPNTVTISGEESAVYTLEIKYPAGSQMNPDALELGWITSEMLLMDYQLSHWYTYTAETDTLLVLSMQSTDWYYYGMFVDAATGYPIDGFDGHASCDEVVVPMQVIKLAAGETVQFCVGTLEGAEIVDFTAYTYAGTAEDPILVDFAWNETGTAGSLNIDLPAGEYVLGAYRISDLNLTVNGVETEVVSAMWGYPCTFTVNNAETGVVALELSYPVGSDMNPAELTMGYNEVTVAEGQVYYYTFTAETDGLLTVTMLTDNWFYVVNNMTTYIYGTWRYSNDEVPVNVTVVAVSAGDVISVQVNTADNLGGYVGFNARFNAGTAEDPAYLELIQVGYSSKLTADLPAGEYVYSLPLYGTSVMELFVNGEKTEYTVVDPFGYYDPNTVTISGEESAVYTLELKYPAGTQMNPDALELGWITSEMLAMDGQLSHWYAYTAEDETLLVLSMQSADWYYWGMFVDAATGYPTDMFEGHASSDDVVVPMQVIKLAAGETVHFCVGTLEGAEIVDFTAYTYAGTAEDPILVDFAWNETGTAGSLNIDLPAGEFVLGRRGISGMTLTVNGVETEIVDGGRYPSTFVVNNAEAGVVALEVSYPVGTWMNPEVVTEGEYTAVLSADNDAGYCYNFIATEAGTLTITVSSEGGWTYTVNNVTTGVYGDAHWSDDDPVVSTYTIEVAEGDIIEILVNSYDPSGEYGVLIAGEVTINLAFAPAVAE